MNIFYQLYNSNRQSFAWNWFLQHPFFYYQSTGAGAVSKVFFYYQSIGAGAVSKVFYYQSIGARAVSKVFYYQRIGAGAVSKVFIIKVLHEPELYQNIFIIKV